MSNMSYCRFQNTSNDLQDCIDSLDNFDASEEEGLSSLSENERRAAEDMYQQCETYIRIFEEAEEEEEGRND